MAKARMCGYRNIYTPNRLSDRKHRPKQFFWEKDRVDDWERIEIKHWAQCTKEKSGTQPQREVSE